MYRNAPELWLNFIKYFTEVYVSTNGFYRKKYLRDIFIFRTASLDYFNAFFWIVKAVKLP